MTERFEQKGGTAEDIDLDISPTTEPTERTQTTRTMAKKVMALFNTKYLQAQADRENEAVKRNDNLIQQYTYATEEPFATLMPRSALFRSEQIADLQRQNREIIHPSLGPVRQSMARIACSLLKIMN
ncbi:hypothetical protein HGB25_01845 [Candidatus Saccharibacteria bacterium]|nr:hypothetical protein [Candidatus Saccharibacteria bacterium]